MKLDRILPIIILLAILIGVGWALKNTFKSKNPISTLTIPGLTPTAAPTTKYNLADLSSTQRAQLINACRTESGRALFLKTYKRTCADYGL
jgi:hypothetical protein